MVFRVGVLDRLVGFRGRQYWPTISSYNFSFCLILNVVFYCCFYFLCCFGIVCHLGVVFRSVVEWCVLEAGVQCIVLWREGVFCWGLTG